MFKKDYDTLLDETLGEIEALNYAEQFLDLLPGFFLEKLPVQGLVLFFLNHEKTEFIPYPDEKHNGLGLERIDWNANLVTYLKNSKRTLVIKDETTARLELLMKTNPTLFKQMKIDVIIPMFSLGKLGGFLVVEANARTYKDLEDINAFFGILSNILIPLVTGERSQVENDRNYYKIYRMDRLALVGELAASAAHEIKNPLAGISTFIKYFMELQNFSKQDIIEELDIIKHSIHRIDEIVKSLLSFSRYKKKEVKKVALAEIIESTLQSMALKIPRSITLVKKMAEELVIETDAPQLQQVLINILFNAVEALGKQPGEITINTYVSGRDQIPSREMFNISIKDNGPGIDAVFKEKLFQPFQTTKEEGTGLGLYTCYGLMKSLGGDIKINSGSWGTEVILSLPYSCDDEAED